MDLTESQGSVNIYFVLAQDTQPDNVSPDMKICYQCCVDHDLCPEWLSEECCLELSPVKQDVFIFEKFQGAAYDYLRNSKCVRIVGPRCIITCLIGGFPVPTGPSPIFTVGMRELVLTTTNFTEDVKKKLHETIEFMGGIYTTKLRKSVTHLIAHRVMGNKVETALETGIPVMTEEWVWAVWAASKERNVHGKDQEFQVHKCDIFHNLSVTCSGLPRKQKESIKEQVTKHGGKFTAELIADKTNILIVAEGTGDKFNHAYQWKLPCVSPAWITESLEKGHVVPFEKYLIKKEVKCSTPVHDASRFLPNFSTISSIDAQASNTTHVNETLMNSTSATVSNMSTFAAMPRTPVKKSVGNNYVDVVNRLDIRDAKRAGPFLDGCKVYLSGFSAEMNEKLRRILNAGGATRFNEISESISHVIVGDYVASDIKAIMSSNFRPHIVRVEWLLESMKNRCPVPEERFSVTDGKQQATEPPSPLSKKGLQLLRRPSESFLQPANLNSVELGASVKEPTPEPDNVVQQYLTASQTEPMESFNSSTFTEKFNTSSQPEKTVRKNAEGNSESLLAEVSSQTSCAGTVEEIFRGLSFTIVGYDSEDTAGLEELIQDHGGRVVSRGFKGIPDYGVVPIQGERLHHTTNEVVTYLWIQDCVEREEIVPIEYYHRPVALDLKLMPLKGCVIGMTTYSGKDRDFVDGLAQLLGAKTQETFARVDCKAKNSVASTHLVCPEPGSQKYMAALKWNLPAVTHEWLLACAREGRRVSEKAYLVKETDTYKGANGNCRKSSVPEMTVSSSATPARNVEPRKSSVASEETDKEAEKSVSSAAPPPQSRTPAGLGCSKGKDENLRETPTRFARPTPKASPDSPPTPLTPWNSNKGLSVRKTVFSPETPIAHLLPSPIDVETPPQNVSLFAYDSDIPTPETPYGQVFKPNPSPATRKFWKKWLDKMDNRWADLELEKVEEPVRKRARRLSTPASELRRQIFIKCGAKLADKKKDSSSQSGDGGASGSTFNQDGSVSDDCKEAPEPDKNSEEMAAGINTQLNNLGHILTVHRKAVNSPRDGSALRRGAEGSDGCSSSSSSKGPDIPASLEINTDIVDWVDPAQSDEILKPKPKFMLSSTLEDKERYKQIIIKLGGSISDQQNFDPTATHLVCTKPARNERVLASMASGKWVLDKSYLDACEEAGCFVEEEPFEWGNPQVMAQLKPKSNDAQLAAAVRRWRRKGGGAFGDMRVLLHVPPEKAASFARLITAGGGRVLEAGAPGATHCLAELRMTSPPLDLGALARQGVPVLPLVFLNNFLVEDPPPSVGDAVFPEYKAELRKQGLSL